MSKATERDYLLSEAFELLGRKLFRTAWDGNERIAFLADTPAQVAAKRRPIERRRQRAFAKVEAIKQEIDGTIDPVRIAELTVERRGWSDCIVALADALGKLPDPADENAAMHVAATAARWHRRQATEAALLEALRHDKIAAHGDGPALLQSWLWTKRPGFKVSLRLNLLRVPDRLSPERWQPVWIKRDGFDAWVRTVKRRRDEAPKSTVEERKEACMAWIEELTKGPKLHSRAWYFDQAKSRFGMSGRAFSAIWGDSDSVPESWRKPGPRPRE